MTTIKERFDEKFTDNRGMFVDISPTQPPAPQRLTKRAYVDILSFFRQELLTLAKDFDTRGLEGEVLIRSLADELK